MLRRAATPALAAALLAAGCAGSTDRYPSLAPRAAEKQGFEEPVRAAPALVADPTLDADIATQATALDEIAAGFDAAAAAARRAGSGRPAVGSEAWLTGQAALARVDDWRARATTLSAGIDAAASTRAARLLPPYPALEALRDRVSTETDREQRVAEELQGLLPAA